VLAAEIPSLPVHGLRLGKQGWDNYTFILNEEWIVRFPKDEEFQSRQELWIAGALQGQVPLAIPRFELVGTRTVLAGYRMLPGVQLVEAWPTFSPAEREQAIDRLVDFCVAVHSSLDVEEAKQNGVSLDDRPCEFVRPWLAEEERWSVHARNALARVDRVSPSVRVLHNDLHGENILADPQTHEVTAVIDFGDVAYGDPCIDLNYLCELDPQSAERIAARYEAAGGGSVDPDRILDLYFLFTLNDFLDPDMPDEERARFHEMLVEYDALFGPR
jgi:aminoglycoside 2''-phosphotransferase